MNEEADTLPIEIFEPIYKKISKEKVIIYMPLTN
jgi:hypothetical protein